VEAVSLLGLVAELLWIGQTKFSPFKPKANSLPRPNEQGAILGEILKIACLFLQADLHLGERRQHSEFLHFRCEQESPIQMKLQSLDQVCRRLCARIRQGAQLDHPPVGKVQEQIQFILRRARDLGRQVFAKDFDGVKGLLRQAILSGVNRCACAAQDHRED
jgi:hypothetical protein